uniref:Uncharacterized protein n=1 Tax=Solanum lycopersicum TaxID=4081 RepID=A0A3Q7GNI9_SOLLC
MFDKQDISHKKQNHDEEHKKQHILLLSVPIFNEVDTNLKSPDDFVTEGVSGIRETYDIAPYSAILLEAKNFVMTNQFVQAAIDRCQVV